MQPSALQTHASVAHEFSPTSLFAEDVALFLDIDGTLAPIACTPDDAEVPPETRDDLGLLHRQLHGALAFVTGRSMQDADRLCAPHRFSTAALHGIQIRLPDGEVEEPASGRECLNNARGVISVLSDRHPELFVEDKEFSLAVHYRRKPELEHGVIDALRTLQTAQADRIFLQEGKMVGELRLRGGDKGTAIRRLLQHPTFRGRRPIFAGDDKTDEDAFHTVQSLGGIGIKIGTGESSAHKRLPDPAAFHQWLRALSAHFTASQPL